MGGGRRGNKGGDKKKQPLGQRCRFLAGNPFGKRPWGNIVAHRRPGGIKGIREKGTRGPRA